MQYVDRSRQSRSERAAPYSATTAPPSQVRIHVTKSSNCPTKPYCELTTVRIACRPATNAYQPAQGRHGISPGAGLAADGRPAQKRAWRPAMTPSHTSQPNSMPPRPAPTRVIRRVSRPLDNAMAPPSQMSLSQPASFREYSGSQDSQYILPASQAEEYQGMPYSQPYPSLDYTEHTPVRPPLQHQPRSTGLSQPQCVVSHSPAHQALGQPLPQASHHIMHTQNNQYRSSTGAQRQAQSQQPMLYRPSQADLSHSQGRLHHNSQAVHQMPLAQPSQDPFSDETQADPPLLAVSSHSMPMSQQLASIPQHQQMACEASEHVTPGNATTPSSSVNPNRLLMKIKSRAAATAISNAGTAPIAAIMQDTATSPLVLPTTSCAQQTDATAELPALNSEAAEQIQQAVAAAVAAQQECSVLATAAIAACDSARQAEAQADMQAQIATTAKACASLETCMTALQSTSELQSTRLSTVEASCHNMLEAVQSLAASTKSGLASLAAQQNSYFSKPVPLRLEQFTQTAAACQQHAQAVQVDLPLLPVHKANTTSTLQKASLLKYTLRWHMPSACSFV